MPNNDIAALFGGRPFTGDDIPGAPPLLDQIRQAMLKHGIQPPPDIIVDGQLHRFATKEGGQDDAGWYTIFPDGVPAGRFGNWRDGTDFTFRADVGRVLSTEENLAIQARLFEAQRRRDEERERQRSEAADTSAKVWARAIQATSDHPYLQRKGIKPHCARVGSDGRLIVPLFDAVTGDLSSLQYISPDGQKRYHPHGKTGGCGYLFGEIGSEVFIAEGFATAATIYEETGTATIAAYSAGNLEPVVGAIRAKYPALTITIVADHDANRVGLNHAEQAAAKHGARIIVPPDLGDANDYRAAGGNVRDLLQPKRNDWLVNALDWAEQGTPVRWVIKHMIQCGELMMVHGPSGVGKSFVVLDWLLSIASGVESWGGHKVTPGTVVYLAGEGHNGLRGRIAAWMQETSRKPDKFWLSKSATTINRPDTLAEVVAYLRSLPEPPAVVAIDTLHRFYDGSENDPEDTRTMIDACALISREFGSAVLLVHHTGVSEEAQKRGRGSSSWKGACNVEFSVRPDGEQIIVEQIKNKDYEEIPPIFVQLEGVTIRGWIDEDGEPVKSAIVKLVERKTATERKKDEKDFSDIRTFREAWIVSGQEWVDEAPYLTSSALKKYLVDSRGIKESGAAMEVKPSVKGRLVSRLVDNGHIIPSRNGFLAVGDDILMYCSVLI